MQPGERSPRAECLCIGVSSPPPTPSRAQRPVQSQRQSAPSLRSGRRPATGRVPTLAPMKYGSVIRFLQFANRRVAYSLTGAGPPLIAPAWWISHLELDWDVEAFRNLWETVGEGYSLVRYDRLGVGMSDREVGTEDLTLDGDVALLSAVLGELGLERVSMVGGSSSGCAAIAFAARFPERVDRLLLYGAYAEGFAITSPEVRQAIVGTVRSHWGLGSRLLAD